MMRNDVGVNKYCVDCDREFTITQRDEEFYNRQGWQLPKRCKACRDNRKAMENLGTADGRRTNR